MDNTLLRRCEQVIKKYEDKDYSDEKLIKIFEKEVRFNPHKTPTEISQNRELCIAVLEQDIKITDKLTKQAKEIKITQDLIEEVNRKPEFCYPAFKKIPLPALPKKESDNSTSVGAVYEWVDDVTYWWDGIAIPVAWLLRVVVFPAFLLSIFPILIINTKRKKNSERKYKIAELDYHCEKAKIEQLNKENYEKYKEKSSTALLKFEKTWKNGETMRNKTTQELQKILLGQQKEMLVLDKSYKYIKKEIFCIPEKYTAKETKEKILSYLKDFKAITFTEAINQIAADEAREKASRLQEEHHQEMVSLKRQTLAEQKRNNTETALRESKKIALQEAALNVQKEIEKDGKKRNELLQKTKEEIMEQLSSIQGELEEVNRPQTNDTSRLTANDIDYIFRKYLN